METGLGATVGCCTILSSRQWQQIPIQTGSKVEFFIRTQSRKESSASGNLPVPKVSRIRSSSSGTSRNVTQWSGTLSRFHWLRLLATKFEKCCSQRQLNQVRTLSTLSRQT